MKLVITIILAGVLIFGGLKLFSRRLLYFPVSLENIQGKRLAELGPAVKAVSVTAEDGVVLHGWIIEKDTAGLPFIFYFGGNAEEVSLNIHDYLDRVAANVVLVNYRGYGKSGGRPTEASLKADALVIFDTLSGQYGIDPRRCAAWGRSLGSSVAAYLTWQRGLGKLILICPCDSIEAVAAGFYPAWLVKQVLADTHRTVDFAGEIRAATLILAASDDEIIPMERTRALLDALPAPKEMEVIQNAGHNTISEFRGYYESVNAFLRK